MWNNPGEGVPERLSQISCGIQKRDIRLLWLYESIPPRRISRALLELGPTKSPPGVAFLMRKDGAVQMAYPSSLVRYVFQGNLRITFWFNPTLTCGSPHKAIFLKLQSWGTDCRPIILNLLSVSTRLCSHSSSCAGNKGSLLGGGLLGRREIT